MGHFSPSLRFAKPLTLYRRLKVAVRPGLCCTCNFCCYALPFFLFDSSLETYSLVYAVRAHNPMNIGMNVLTDLTYLTQGAMHI